MYGRDRDRDTGPKKFEFRKRTVDDINERATRRISEFDSLYLIPVRNFKAKVGENRIRFLPATWPDAKHYGYDIHIHRNIGPDNTRYLCRKKMLQDRCVLCDEQYTLHKEGATEEAAELKPQARVISWVIDRSNESEGPFIWEMSASQDLDIASLQANKRTGDVFLCEDPEEGYDLSFSRQGTTLKTTRYRGWQFDRTPTPVSDDPEQMQMWLSFVADNPIPDILKFYDNNYIGKVFFPSAAVEKEEEERPTLRSAVTRETTRRRDPVEDEEPTRKQQSQSLTEDLDDEVPFDRPATGRNARETGNGRTSDGNQWKDTQSYAKASDGPVRPPRPRASSKQVEEEDDDETPPDDDVHSRMRERLQRRQERREP